MKNTIYNLFMIVIIGLISGQVNAAEISLRSPHGITISGKIEAGDYDKLKNFLLDENNLENFTSLVELNSPGGNVDEAIKISNLLKMGFAKVAVLKGDVCFSSCFLIYAGGVQRILLGKLGVHRLSLIDNEVSVKNNEKIVDPKSKDVENFLLSMGIPRKIIDKMNETSPADLFTIDLAYLNQEKLVYAMEYQPNFIDVVEKQCGLSPVLAFERGGSEPSENDLQKFTDCSHRVRGKNLNLELENFIKMILK